MSIRPHDIFTRLVVETRDNLRRYVRKMVRSDESVEEIMQEAFLRTYEKRDSVKTPQAFLFSTARNLVTDKFRKEHGAPVESIEDLAEREITGEEEGLEAF